VLYVTNEATGERRRATVDDQKQLNQFNTYVKWDFGSPAWRTFELFLLGSSAHTGLRGMNCTPGYTIEAAPALADRPKILVVGDSHVNHANGSGDKSVRTAWTDWFGAAFGTSNV